MGIKGFFGGKATPQVEPTPEEKVLATLIAAARGVASGDDQSYVKDVCDELTHTRQVHVNHYGY